MSDQEHQHPAPTTPAPDSVVEDVGSRALSEALGSSFFFVKIVMAALVIIFLVSGAVKVDPGQRAMILRFGKVQGEGDARLLGPGLHFAFPPPIDEVVKIPIGQIQSATSTVGWYAVTPEQEVAGVPPPATPSLNPSIVGYTITGDGNIIHARARIGYRVTDAPVFVFNFTAASNVVQTVLDSALVWASSRMTVDDAIKNNDAFKEKVVAHFTRLADELNLGITLDTMTVTVVPPLYTKDAFDAVTGAQQDRDKVIQAAQGMANVLLATARSETNAIVDLGKAARTRYLESMVADAHSFSDQLPGYQKNPELFRQRLLTETWQRVLAGVRDKTIIPFNGKPYELRLLLNREPERQKTNAPAGNR